MISISRIYLYVRARQLEGDYPGDSETGTYAIACLRILKGWGAPSELEWPYPNRGDAWPPKEPEGIDAKAKANRILYYRRVRNLDDCKVCLASEQPIMVAVDFTDQWYTANNGEIEMPLTGTPIVASNSVILTGYNDATRRFGFANSWGQEWGMNGHGTLPYAYIEIHCSDAWVFYGSNNDRPPPTGAGVSVVQWGDIDPRGNVNHAVEIVDNTNDEIKGWAFCVERDGFLDIEELFVKPDHRGNRLGRLLANELQRLSSTLNLPVRAWIPHGDGWQGSYTTMKNTLAHLNLTIGVSGVRWARFKATRKFSLWGKVLGLIRRIRGKGGGKKTFWFFLDSSL
jgi:GNAT superfamily N-acetyltransferase